MFDNFRNVLDFDDLLFESRNREYGAYMLRKKYNAVVFGGILMASVLVSAAVLLPFLLTSRNDRVHTGSLRYVNVQIDQLEPPMEEIIVPPPPPPPEAARIEETLKYIPPVVVDSVPPLEKQMATTDQYMDQTETTEQTEITGNGTGDEISSGESGSETDQPFYFVEVMPAFKGGDINKFREWVMKRTNYPQAAIDNKIQGKVFLTFIVETDGAVTNVTVVKGVDPIIDNEAVKSIQASPKWSPGLQRGQAVRVRYSMSLNFAPY